MPLTYNFQYAQYAFSSQISLLRFLYGCVATFIARSKHQVVNCDLILPSLISDISGCQIYTPRNSVTTRDGVEMVLKTHVASTLYISS